MKFNALKLEKIIFVKMVLVDIHLIFHEKVYIYIRPYFYPVWIFSAHLNY